MSLIEHARGFMNGIRGDAGVGAENTETNTEIESAAGRARQTLPSTEPNDDEGGEVAELLAEWDAQPQH